MRRTLLAMLLVLASVARAQDFIKYSPSVLSSTGGTLTGPLSVTGGSPGASLDVELVTNGTFTPDLTGWAGANWSSSAGTALHTAGVTTALSQNVSMFNGATYELCFTISGRTAGSVGVAVGTVSIVYTGANLAFDQNIERCRTFLANATGSVALAFTPTSPFDGALDGVTLRGVVPDASQAFSVYDSDTTLFGGFKGNAADFNLMVGNVGLRFNTSGTYNHGFGLASLTANTTGTSNTAFGYAALNGNTNGSFNTAVGDAALEANSEGASNTAVGLRSIAVNTTGSNNTALGDHTLFSAVTVNNNTAVGFEALYATTVGNNTAVGTQSLRKNTTGDSNAAFGQLSLYNNTTGSYSTAVGYNAMAFMVGGILPYNVGVGANAGSESGSTPTIDNRVTSGTKLTFIGANSGLGSATQRTNATALGSEAYVDADNTVALGDENVTSVLASSDGGATVTAAAFKVGANTGISGTVVVKGSDGNNCNLVFEGGIVTSETCP